MTDSTQQQEHDEPNELGFAGEPAAPEPKPASTGEGFGEAVAVPAGDITGAITAAIEDATTGEDSAAGEGEDRSG